MNSVSLHEFMVLYPDFNSIDKNIYSERLYGEKNPEVGFYRKGELYENKLTRSEDKPKTSGIALKAQLNISRLMSPLTLNDEMLLFHGLGSGKCVDPSSIVKVNGKDMTILSLWDNYSTRVEFIDSGYWTTPSITLDIQCVDIETQTLISRPIKKLYRQYIYEDIYTVCLSNGKKITCTGKHMLYTNYGWCETMKIINGMNVAFRGFTNRIEWCKIVNIYKKIYTGYVYDLEVDSVHNYLCNDILTHNTCSSVNISELCKKMNPSLKKTLILLRGGTLKRNFIRELAFKCTDGRYIPENYKDLTKAEKIIRLNKMVNKRYEIHTFETFAKNIIDKNRDEFLRDTYSNRVIVIDEVHNIRLKTESKKSGRDIVSGSKKDNIDIYASFHRFLHLLYNRKIILMSATPMRDRPEEFASVMNLILPVEKQISTGNSFIEEYYLDGVLKNKKLLKSFIRGRVSYLRSMETNVLKIFKGKLYNDMKVLKLFGTEMDNFQRKYYEQAYSIDKGTVSIEDENINEYIDEDKNEDSKDEKSQGLYDKSRQASLFVYPDGSYGSEGFKKYIVKKGSLYFMSNELKNILTDSGKATQFDIIDNISKHSSIYAETIKEIIKYENENIFIYNKYVQGSGIILFSELLKLVGFEKYTQSENRISGKNKFALITGELASESSVDRIIDTVFNDPFNKHGENLRIIIGSQLIGEGKSLKNVRQIHIHTPHWNNSETEQAIARGIRSFSHDDLNIEDRFVKVFRHCSIPKTTSRCINYKMYKISEDKEMLMKQVERVCKETSIDCLLNTERNMIDSDIDGTRECDYTNCKYKCDYTSSNSDIIHDTYNLFYSTENIDSIINILKQLYRTRFFFTFNELEREFDSISKLVLLRSLKYCIDSNIILINKYGFPCYLREDKNMYFLVDNISLPNSYNLVFYSEFPYINRKNKFEDIVSFCQYKYIDDIISIIESIDYKNRDEVSNISKIFESINPILREIFLEQCIVAENKNIDKIVDVRRKIIEYHKIFITRVGDKTTSSLLQEFDDRIRCIDDNTDEWYDCDENIEDNIKKVKDDEKNSMKDNPYGFYGIMAQKKNKVVFKIMKVQDKKQDSRLNPRGAVCAEIVPMTDINNIINSINRDSVKLKYEKDFEIDDRGEFIDRLIAKNPSFSKKYLKSLDIETFKTLYYWYFNVSKKSMCQSLQQWFADNNLLLYEK